MSNRRIVVAVLLVAAMASGGAVSVYAAEVPKAPAPRIEFSEVVFDFGSVYQNAEVIHVFKFRNAGDAILKIENVKTTCGCTAAMPESRELAPGAESSIKVTFRSGSFHDRVTKHIDVDSNDPMQPRVTLTVQGIVKVEVELKPSGIYFGSSTKVGEKIERTIEITPVDVKSFKITDVTSDNPEVKVSKPQPLGDKRPGYRLVVTLGPFDRVGRVNGKLIVRTNLPHTKQITILVYGKVVSGESPEPARAR